jgi:hypothetical protein
MTALDRWIDRYLLGHSPAVVPPVARWDLRDFEPRP